MNASVPVDSREPCPSPALLLALLPLLASAAQVPGSLEVDLLDNGQLRAPLPTVRDARGQRPVPWWETVAGVEQLELIGDEPCLRTGPGEWARQPLPAFAPLSSGAVLTGEVAGAGRVTITCSRPDGTREGIAFEVQGAGDGAFAAFELALARLDERLGAQAMPRFELELAAAMEGETARWRRLAAPIPLPAPTPDELRAEILGELEWIFALWLERSTDNVGPRSTRFLTHVFDVVTGERLIAIDGGHNIFFDLLFRVLRHHEGPGWRAAFEGFVEDFLALGLHPDTGLPRPWDTVRDQPKDEQGMEIAPQLAFLLELTELGPERFRGPARAAALRIGETVLATGLAPDGGVAAKYRPADGEPDLHVTHLRRLDLPAQLGRLARLADDPRYLDAAREAAAAVEYAHTWPGSWLEVDPGWDDIYGHFGRRATDLLEVWPQEPIFRRLAIGRLEHYLPLWHDAVRLGGNVAADQVRCWEITRDLVALEPRLAERAVPALADAVRGHFKGQQYGNGAWGDVTSYGYDPLDHLQVGDLPGLPQNLMQGLAMLYERGLEERGGIPRAELRARFAAVLLSSRSTYRRDYGYLSTRREAAGANPARGSIALATALVEMLEQLDGDAQTPR